MTGFSDTLYFENKPYQLRKQCTTKSIARLYASKHREKGRFTRVISRLVDGEKAFGVYVYIPRNRKSE